MAIFGPKNRNFLTFFWSQNLPYAVLQVKQLAINRQKQGAENSALSTADDIMMYHVLILPSVSVSDHVLVYRVIHHIYATCLIDIS